MFLLSIASYPRWGRIVLGESDVEKFNLVPLYWLAYRLSALESALSGAKPSTYSLLVHLLEARLGLEVITTTLPARMLSLSQKAARATLFEIDNLLEAHSILGIPPKDDYLKKHEIDSLKASITHFNSILPTELPQENIYYATPKLAYDMAILINNGEQALPENIVKSLGASRDRFITDIRESAKCLAFGISTAVGFHIYRAIECIVIDDYFPLIGVVPSDYEKNPNLGNYIKLLKDKKVNDKVTTMLAHIKDEYRNPISHPEEFWDINKASSAFGVALSTITIMLTDIDETRKRAPTP